VVHRAVALHKSLSRAKSALPYFRKLLKGIPNNHIRPEEFPSGIRVASKMLVGRNKTFSPRANAHFITPGIRLVHTEPRARRKRFDGRVEFM